MKHEPIKIFDTTLRDGQQCPGAGMAFEKNIEYAKLAAKAGIDILEAGFPSASQTDFMIVNTIASELVAENSGNCPTIAGLCQLREQQIEVTIQALQPAIAHKKARLHTYLPVDPQLMLSSLGSYANQKEQILNDLYRFIKQAYDAGLEVEFSPEGYSRMGENFNFVTDAICAAIEGGATIINCPDTIGGACKLEGDNYFVEHMKRHAAIIAQKYPNKEICWSAHCHNDFGLALENTMNAIFFGPVTQIEGCINGIGERAGNVSLEQCIMYIKHFGDMGKDKTFTTHINTQVLQELSDFVNHYMLPRQPHWPITGENAAKHSSGGHTNAVIKNPLVYQPFDPKVIGKEISFLFGPLSGGNHAKTIIEQFGYICGEDEKAAIAQYIKNHYSDRRKGITDQELLQGYLFYRQPIKVTRFDYAKTGDCSMLSIIGDFFSQTESFTISYQGHESPLAALHKAIDQYFPGISIETYNSHSASQSIKALSQSKIVIKTKDEELFTGIGEDNDIEISALKALTNAINQAYIHEFYRIKQQEITA